MPRSRPINIQHLQITVVFICCANEDSARAGDKSSHVVFLPASAARGSGGPVRNAHRGKRGTLFRAVVAGLPFLLLHWPLEVWKEPSIFLCPEVPSIVFRTRLRKGGDAVRKTRRAPQTAQRTPVARGMCTVQTHSGALFYRLVPGNPVTAFTNVTPVKRMHLLPLVR